MASKKPYSVCAVEELDRVAPALIHHFPAERVFAFYGPMGIGKTTFIKSICRALGSDDLVSSPSFSIVNHYMTHRGASLYHFDFYRINKLEEVFDMGYEEYLYSGNYCFIEWPEKMESLLPDHCVRVYMEEKGGCRVIHF